MRALGYLFGIVGAGFALWALSNIVVWQFNIASYRATREPLIGAFFFLSFALASVRVSGFVAWFSPKTLHRTDIWFVWCLLIGVAAVAVAFFVADAGAVCVIC